MQYRTFGSLDYKPSALGFGCMRFPSKDGQLDVDEAVAMIRSGIDSGINYLDTAYPYHDGRSEGIVGQAIKGGYRDKVKITTKMPTWLVKKAEDFDTLLDEQLSRLGLDSVDFYLLHSIGKDEYQRLKTLGVLEWAEKAMAQGRFGRLGFSSHDSFEGIKYVLDDYDSWVLCQIQYNYIDSVGEPGTKCLKYIASKGVAAVIMEGLRGGSLVGPPPPIEKIWDKAARKRSPADWGLQWLWSQPEVSLVLSGMSSMEQVEQNIASASASRPGLLSAEELGLFDEARAEYKKLTAVPCTGCRYCMPCPNGVDIPRNFGIYNDGIRFDKPEKARGDYAWMLQAQKLGLAKADERAASCVGCRACEAQCPQKIPIADWMEQLKRSLGGDAPLATRLPAR
jgi:predicted aldo/keto reductase-like oxidoreductase